MLRIRCHKHVRYDGKSSPRASCEGCIAIYHLRIKAITDRLEIVGAKPTAKESKSE